jgi:hypothetical protein
MSITGSCTDCLLYRGFAYKDLEQYDKAIKDFSLLLEIEKTEPSLMPTGLQFII